MDTRSEAPAVPPTWTIPTPSRRTWTAARSRCPRTPAPATGRSTATSSGVASPAWTRRGPRRRGHARQGARERPGDAPDPGSRSREEYCATARWESLTTVENNALMDAESSLVQVIVAGDPRLRDRGPVYGDATKRYWPARGVASGGRLWLAVPDHDAEMAGVGNGDARGNTLMRLVVLDLADVTLLDAPAGPDAGPRSPGDHARIGDLVEIFEEVRGSGNAEAARAIFDRLGGSLREAGFAAVVRGGMMYIGNHLLPECGAESDEFGCEAFRSALILDLDREGGRP